jgi:ATP-dependent Clp protease ATP-binding subunit ClpX
MPAKLFADRILNCSFCAKPEPEVSKMIAGPGVYICDQCVRLCEDLLAQEAARSAEPDPTTAPESPEIPVADRMTDSEILDLLPRIASVSAQVDASLQVWVDRLRARGVSWARIGEAMGVARQSAWEKFATQD